MFFATAQAEGLAGAHLGEDVTAEDEQRRAAEEAELAVYPPLRSDLVVHRAHFRKRPSYVIKDPVALKYYRLGEREFQAVRQLDGHRRGFEIVEEMQRLRPGESFAIADLAAIVQSVMRMGLLALDPTAARQLHGTLRELLKQLKAKTRLKRFLGNVVMVKIPLFDPDLLLLRMDKKLGFLWTRRALYVQIALLASAAVLVASHSSMLVEKVPDLFTLQNMIIMWFCFIGIKVVHEFGHGLACKHFGGEVHEMGAMFIVFTPYLYCNASDSWIFPHKWQRLVVNFAGIYLEMFLAAIAAFVWVFTPPGLLHQIAFDIMIIASVTTVLFNINPLMKFDGYYALADWLELPNMKERADRDLIGRIAAFFVGPEGRVRDRMSDSLKLLVVYGVLSYLWVLFICYNILRGIAWLLEPYGLHQLAGSAAAFVIGGGIFIPLIMASKRVREVLRLQGDDPAIRRRFILGLGASAVLLLVLFFLPVPRHVSAALVLDGSNRVPVTAATAGFVEETLPRGTVRVGAGQTLARLRNPDAAAQLADAEADMQVGEIVANEITINFAREALGPALARLRSARARLEQARRESGQLELKAPFEAVVLTPDLNDWRGRYLARGETFCELLPVGQLAAVMALDERSASLVQAGQTVVFRLSSDPLRRFTGTVQRTLRHNISELPHQALASAAGGTVELPSGMAMVNPADSPQDAPSARLRDLTPPPIYPVYRAEILLDNADGFLRPGMSGRARVHTGNTTIAALAWESLTRIVRTEFRL